jgi:hypothetical protein
MHNTYVVFGSLLIIYDGYIEQFREQLDLQADSLGSLLSNLDIRS